MSEKSIDFIFGIHCHQPVGNFEHVFEESYQRSYLPFINMARKHPGIKIVFHYCGILLEWFSDKHPEFLAMLEEMLDSGQAEVIGGGLREPILPVIPEADQAAQIRAMSSFVREKLGHSPKGAWLAERVWEPHLAKTLKFSGIDYVMVDDHHFRLSGLKDSEIYGYFTTEEEGFPLTVFPINEKLRYLVPFKSEESVLDFFRDAARPASGGEPMLVTLVDDGEKFGVWPGTFKWVYEEGWLDRFFNLLDDNPWIRTLTLSEALKQHRSRGIIYLPPGSYKEMLEWSGGFWRNYLVKYPESNNLHKKMLFVSAMVRKLGELGSGVFREAQGELMKGQCNDPYWHGIFGGLYLNYLRGACYSHLIRAEFLADNEIHGNSGEWLYAEETDFNKDGMTEVLLSNRLINVYLSPSSGGQIFEIDFKGGPFFNITDTMSRRFEEYHLKIKKHAEGEGGKDVKSIHDAFNLKNEGLEELLKYDSYRKVSLVDHFLEEGAGMGSFRDLPPATGFAHLPYEYRLSRDQGTAEVRMSGEESGIRVEKTVLVEQGKSLVRIHYVVSNKGKEDIRRRFCSEFNLSLLAGDDPKRYYEFPGAKISDSRLASSGSVSAATCLRLVDEWQGMRVSLSFSPGADVWRFPIYTVSQSESGIEQTYQGSTVVPNWKISVPQGGKWECDIVLEIDKI